MVCEAPRRSAGSLRWICYPSSGRGGAALDVVGFLLSFDWIFLHFETKEKCKNLFLDLLLSSDWIYFRIAY